MSSSQNACGPASTASQIKSVPGSQSRSIPVSRSNLPPYPYGPPPQGTMYASPQQQAALQYQQRQQHEQARIAMLNRQRQQQAEMARRLPNGKMMRAPDEDVLDVMVPERLKKSYGPLVQPRFAFETTHRIKDLRFISPDLMDALHLGDKGYFLLSDAGFKYYLWRYAARLDNPSKSYYDNILGHIEPFHIDPNGNKPSTVIASTYHFFYDQWAKTTLKIEIQKLFCQVALKQGTSGSQKITRAWKKVNSYFAKAREIYLKTPGDPLEAVAFLTTAEEFWWDDAHDPLVTSPSRKVTHEDKGEEIFYLHEVDRAAVNKACHYGHLSRSIDIWSTPRTRTSLWAPNCKPRRGSIVQPEKISWTARLTPLAGLEKELKPPLIRESSPNFWEQAQEWVSTVDKQEDRAIFESFDFEKAKADDLLNFKEETPPPSPVAAHGMDAEAIPNEEPRSKRVRDEEEQDKEVSRKRARVEEEVTQDTSSVRLETSPSEPKSIQQQITPLNLDRSSETG